jgi:predicted kinase
MKKYLKLLVGPSGAGKTTLAKSYEREGYFRISQDEQGQEGHLNNFIALLLKGVNHIIIDRMNFNKQQRQRYIKLARDLNYHIEIIVLHENYETCFKRCVQRLEYEGHETIKNEDNAKSALNTFFTKYERPTNDEADVITFNYPEGKKPQAIWVDIDNTLSNTSHREHFLRNGKKDWKGFFANMDKDPVNMWCKQLIDGMSNVCHILICSARPENYRQQTEDWLKSHNINYDQLIMRNRQDRRNDSIVKEIMYEFEIRTKYDLLFSVDDRKRVIDKMREHVVVLDCAGEKGNF